MKRDRLGWALILWLALVLRLWGLADHNIWWDEGYTVHLARMPAPQLVDTTAHDTHPPGHYLLTRGWLLLMGEDEWTLRFPSVVAGVLTVALAAALGRALGGRRAGLLAGLLLSLAPFLVAWSQELRMYMWAAAAAAAALLAAFAFWRGGGWRAWVAYVLATTAGLFTIYLSIVVPAITNLAFLVAWWRQGRSRTRLASWIAAQAVVVALFLPWLAYTLPRMTSWSISEPFDAGFFVRLYATVLATGATTDLDAWFWPTAAVFLVLLLAAGALLRRKWPPATAGGLAMLVLGLLLPAAMVYAMTVPGRDFYVPRLSPRYFLPLAASLYVLLGWGLAVLGRRRRVLAAAGLGIVVVVLLLGLCTAAAGRGQTDDYLSLAATLEAHRRPADTVLLYSDAEWPIFSTYFPGPWARVPAGMVVSPDNVDGLLAPIWQGTDGVWLVNIYTSQEPDPQRLVPGWLEAHAVGQAQWSYGDTTLTFYAATSGRDATRYDLAAAAIPPTGSGIPLAGGELLHAELPLARYLAGDILHLALTWARPPDQAAQLALVGPVTRTLALPDWPAAASGPTRQQVDWPLLADLPAGRYRLTLADIELARFTLVPRGAILSPAAGEAMQPLNLRLGDSIVLVGYELPRAAVQPGDAVELTLYWKTTGLIAARYKVFTHLVGATWNAGSGNFLWGQQDNEPMGDRLPTTQWAPGALIADTYRIALEPAAPPGVYTVEVGMYGLTDGIRLPVFDAQGEAQGDAVTLGQITVQ